MASGLLPAVGAKLEKLYQSKRRKKAKHMPESTITFRFVRRGDKIVLRSESVAPFEITDALISALIDGFTKGSAIESTREL